MSRRPLVALGLLATVLVALAAGSAWRPEPALRGTDEVFYLGIRGLDLQPGESWTEPVPVQHPGLSWVAFPYRIDGAGPGRIHLRLESNGGELVLDRHLRLAPTPAIDAPSVWFEATFWGPVARFVELRVTPPAQARELRLTVEVERGSPPVALFWNAVDPTTDPVRLVSFAGGSGPESTSLRRFAVTTGYGPVAPAPLRLGTLLDRIGRVAPPWLPSPLPGLLALAALVLGLMVVAAIGAAEPYSPDGVEPQAPAQRLDPGQAPGP